MIEVAGYSQLHVFDLFKKVAASDNKTSVDNPMLPVVLRAIFESTTIEQRNQLPLAIRYNDHVNVKKVLTHAGIQRNTDQAHELTVDGRQLIYAAFYDNAKIVREMLRSGFDVSQLDHLIALEIKQEMCCQKLLEYKGSDAAWHDEPMPTWAEKLHRQGITASEVKAEWSNLPKDEQITRTLYEVKKVAWDKMAFVNGWMYRVIVQVNDVDVKAKVKAGTIFRQTGAKDCQPFTGLDKKGPPTFTGLDANWLVAVRAKNVQLVCMDTSCAWQNSEWGATITVEEATEYITGEDSRNDYGDLDSQNIKTLERMLSVANATGVKKDGGHNEIYVKLEHPDLGWLILRRDPEDEIVGCLELGGLKDRQSEGIQRQYRKNDVGGLMYGQARKAFAPWLEESVSQYDLLAQPFDPLLRIYWAIATRRDALAKEFWMDASNSDSFQPFGQFSMEES